MPSIAHEIKISAPVSAVFKALTNVADIGSWCASEGTIATKYVNDVPAQGVARTMPLCKFPEMARYGGSIARRRPRRWANAP